MGKGSYDTFTSGQAVNIPDKGDGNYDTKDSGTPQNDVSHGAVPEVPQKG